ncbi:MAG TPA: HD domain-containing protein [Candidatus Dormibacteraeota bacterium]|nr:HD domain-containing protein [Candidatus Dormibacteraeota bacterium]
MTGPEAPAAYRRVNLSSDPIHRYVQITKPGGVPGAAAEQDLIDHVWVQRLRRIHQMQSAWWVFATAEHSRFQHALGAMHLAGEWARRLYPTLQRHHPDVPSPPVVVETLRLAGLLHDVGHGPFGHFFDENYLARWGVDHEVIGRHLILHELAPLIAELRADPEADFGPGEHVDPRWVAYLISTSELRGFDPPGWLVPLRALMVGPFSADNMDYVPRDAYVCGVAVGPVDVQRIVHYSFISEHGLTLHLHGAEALFMFLSARLYLYHQVYFHRTVRRIDLQLREIFAATMDVLLGGNPLERLPAYQRLDDWWLITEVGGWARAGSDPSLRDLGRAWADLIARRLKWRLIYSGYVEGREVPSGALTLTGTEFARRIRERLPPDLRSVEFEVDVAAQDSRAFNPLMEDQDILFYDPLSRTYERSRVLDLFRRLPVRMAIFRIFARDDRGRAELIRAARQVLAAA